MSLKRNIHPLIEKEVPSLNNLLDPKDVSAFKELTQELRDTWTKKQIFRTETEMRFSVLNDFKYPTKAAKYWQCVREQNVYLENLMNLSFDYRKEDVKLRQLKQKIKKEKDPLEKELIQIDIDEKNFNKAAMELTAKDRMREIQLWSKIKKEVDYGSFDKDDVNAHQIESYHQIMLNRKNTLTQASTQPEVFNVMGQLDGIEKLKTQKNALENKKREAISSQSSIGAKSK
jgi:hypothetical protein